MRHNECWLHDVECVGRTSRVTLPYVIGSAREYSMSLWARHVEGTTEKADGNSRELCSGSARLERQIQAIAPFYGVTAAKRSRNERVIVMVAVDREQRKRESPRSTHKFTNCSAVESEVADLDSGLGTKQIVGSTQQLVEFEPMAVRVADDGDFHSADPTLDRGEGRAIPCATIRVSLAPERFGFAPMLREVVPIRIGRLSSD